MRTIYIDSDFKCHVADDGTMTAVEVSFFDGKCDAYIEGYRYVPAGSTWIRDDGEKFNGIMKTTWKPHSELAAAQAQYERDMAELAAAYQEGVDSV